MPSPFAVRDPEEIELVDRLFKEGRPLNGSADFVAVELRDLATRRGVPYTPISEGERRYWVDSGGSDAPKGYVGQALDLLKPLKPRPDSNAMAPSPTPEEIQAANERAAQRKPPTEDDGFDDGPPGGIDTVVGRALPGAVGYTAGKYLGFPHPGDWDKEKQAQALSKWAGSGDAYPVDLIEAATSNLPPVYGAMAVRNAYDFLSETDGNAWERIQQDPARAAQLLMDTAVMLHGRAAGKGEAGPEVRAPETEAGPILTREGIKQRIGQLREQLEGSAGAGRGSGEPGGVRGQARDYIDAAPLPEDMKPRMKALVDEPGTQITLPEEGGAVPGAGNADLPESRLSAQDYTPGEQVIHGATGRAGTVVGIEGDRVRIQPNDGEKVTYKVKPTELRVVPPATPGGPTAAVRPPASTTGPADDPLFLSDVVTPVPRPEPIDPADYEVLIQKFNRDPAGERRLREQLAGVEIPRQKVTLAEQGRQARLLADRLGLDRDTLADKDLVLKAGAGRLSGVEINALMDTVGDNLELIERVSPKLGDATATPEAIDQARRIIDAATEQNNALLGKVVSARSQLGRDFGSLRLLMKQSTEPAVWLAMAKRNLGDRVLSEEMAEEITRLAKAAGEACHGR